MVAVEEEEILVDEEVKVDMVMEGDLFGNRRSYQIPPLTKEMLKELSIRYARNLATWQQHVGSSLHR